MACCIPKGDGQPEVDEMRPTTLLCVKAKWVTGILAIALQDVVNMGVPSQQKGFMRGRQMMEHLKAVHSMKSKKGTWFSLDLSKAFDSTSYLVMEVLLKHIRVPLPWVQMMMDYFKGQINLLVGPT